MKKLLLLLSLFFSLIGSATANPYTGINADIQQKETDSSSNRETQKSILTFEFNNGIGLGNFIDKGVSPLLYNGPHVMLNFNVGYQNNERFLFYRGKLLGGAYHNSLSQGLNFYSFGGSHTSEAGILWGIFQHNNFHLFLGPSLSTSFLIQYNSRFMNSDLGCWLFGNLGFHARVEHSLPTKHNRVLTSHWELKTSPFSTMFIPGYAYLDNYTSSNSVSETYFSDYKFKATSFNQVSSDLGIEITTAKQNKIGISYFWNYLTTHNSTNNPFNEASHTILFTWKIQMK